MGDSLSIASYRPSMSPWTEKAEQFKRISVRNKAAADSLILETNNYTTNYCRNNQFHTRTPQYAKWYSSKKKKKKSSIVIHSQLRRNAVETKESGDFAHCHTILHGSIIQNLLKQAYHTHCMPAIYTGRSNQFEAPMIKRPRRTFSKRLWITTTTMNTDASTLPVAFCQSVLRTTRTRELTFTFRPFCSSHIVVTKPHSTRFSTNQGPATWRLNLRRTRYLLLRKYATRADYADPLWSLCPGTLRSGLTGLQTIPVKYF